MTRLLLRMIVIGALAGSSTRNPVRAQPASPTQDEQAKQYTDAGIEAYQSGDYDAAIALYQKAYQLHPHPALLFNMAQAYRRSQRPQVALPLYRRYLADAPDGDEAGLARQFVAELEAAAGTAHEPRDAGAPVVAEAPPGRSLRIAGLAAAGAGIAALAVGTGFALHGRTLSNRFRPGAQWNQDTFDAGERANTITIAGFISGGALVATGAVLYWLGHAQAHGLGQPVVAPAVGDRGVSLVLLAPWP